MIQHSVRMKALELDPLMELLSAVMKVRKSA